MDELLLEQPVEIVKLNSNYYNLVKPIIIQPNRKHEIQIIFATKLEYCFAVHVIKYGESVNIKEGITFNFEASSNVNYNSLEFGLISGFRFVPIGRPN